MPLLYLAALVLGVGETLFDTASQSILTSLVDRADLSEANGRLQAVELTTNQFVGPPLGGLLAAASLTAAFAASSGSYLVAALCLTSILGTFRPTRVRPTRNMRQDIAEGLRFVWRKPLLRTLGLMLGVINLASTAHQSVFVLFAVNPGPLGMSKTGFGLLLASGGLGGLTGSTVAAPLERTLGRTRCLVGAIVVFAVSLAVPLISTGIVATPPPSSAVPLALSCGTSSRCRSARNRPSADLRSSSGPRVDGRRGTSSSSALLVRVDGIVLELVVEAHVVHPLEDVVASDSSTTAFPHRRQARASAITP